MSVSSNVTSNLNPNNKISKLPRPGKPNALSLGIPAIGAGLDAFGRISNGEKVIPSIAKATGKAIIDDVMFGMLLGPWGQGLYFAGTLASIAGSLAIENGKENVKNLSALSSDSMMRGKNVINSRNAQTMRQRGMAMINQNGEATRSVFGNEARAYFRNSF